jgi:hypothetical protein
MNNDLPPITPIHSTILYGIWIYGKGWLKKDNDPKKTLSFQHKEIAKEVAKCIGGAVRYIDQSLIDIEPELLHKERKPLWVTLQNFFKRKINTSPSSKTTKAS